MPLCASKFSNEALVILAERRRCRSHDAFSERLVRNIMHVDGVDRSAAKEKLQEIAAEHRKVVWLVTLPHKVGISAAAIAGLGCVPMVFSLAFAGWFNAHFVTCDVPEARDLETVLEVGCWTWNWVEPLMGTATFALLSLQLVRSQMLNMHWTSYTSWVQNYRAELLQGKYPQYNAEILMEYARTASLKPSGMQ